MLRGLIASVLVEAVIGSSYIFIYVFIYIYYSLLLFVFHLRMLRYFFQLFSFLGNFLTVFSNQFLSRGLEKSNTQGKQSNFLQYLSYNKLSSSKSKESRHFQCFIIDFSFGWPLVFHGRPLNTDCDSTYFYG